MADGYGYQGQSLTPGSNPGLGAGAFGMIPGFSSLLLPALMSFAPALFNKLLGRDPAKELRRRVAQLTSAGNVGKLTNEFYQQAQGSPAFSQAQGNIATGANIASADVARSLAARGIGTSGQGAILSGLTPSLVGSQQAGLRSSAYQGAQNQAQQAIQAQLAALGGAPQFGAPSPTQGFFGAGLEAFAPFLQQYLKSKFPGYGNQFGG